MSGTITCYYCEKVISRYEFDFTLLKRKKKVDPDDNYRWDNYDAILCFRCLKIIRAAHKQIVTDFLAS